jgi:hypothetical protein
MRQRVIRDRRAGPTRPATIVLLLLSGLCLSGSNGLAQAIDDEAFIRSVEMAGDDETLDRGRLAKLFFGLAATLDGGKSSVNLLRSSVRVRDASAESVRATVSASYGRYADAVERFKGGVSTLLDSPDDAAALFRALSGGHEACWRLDAYTQLVVTYGARSQDLLSILSSTEACARYRRVAFRPVVERLIIRDLAETDALRIEAREMSVELEELERLLDDLRRIEASD